MAACGGIGFRAREWGRSCVGLCVRDVGSQQSVVGRIHGAGCVPGWGQNTEGGRQRAGGT